MMAPGESRRFWIPPELAFGTNESAARWQRAGSPAFFPDELLSHAAQATTKPTGPLTFDVELYSIERIASGCSSASQPWVLNVHSVMDEYWNRGTAVLLLSYERLQTWP